MSLKRDLVFKLSKGYVGRGNNGEKQTWGKKTVFSFCRCLFLTLPFRSVFCCETSSDKGFAKRLQRSQEKEKRSESHLDHANQRR